MNVFLISFGVSLFLKALPMYISEVNMMITPFFKELYKNRSLYLFALPAMLLLFGFNYMPLFGLLIAFKNYTFDQGIFGSPWMDPFYHNFKFLFQSSQAFRALRNTLLLNGLFILGGIVTQVGFALMLNEIARRRFKKLAQSATFLPYFISWIVVGVFTYVLFNSEHGLLNGLLAGLGMQPIDWYSSPHLWPIILTLIACWKTIGYGSVVYLATLSGIDATYYEAAEIDGASRWQQIVKITLPLLRPTLIMLTLLALGRIMNADFGMFYAIIGDASLLYPTTDVIDTFVYRGLRVSGDIGMSSATGFIQSVLSFILVVGFNMIVRKMDRDSALF